jgi:hypothetical protein
MTEADAPIPAPSQNVALRPDLIDQDVTPEPDVEPEAKPSRESVDDMLRRMATLRHRYERAKKRGEFLGRAVIATTELPDGTLTLHLAIESEIHEHPLRALESLAICAAILAGNRRKLRKFYVPGLDCRTPIRRSQVILARDQRCRACRARLQRERRRKKLQAKAEAGQGADNGQAERTEEKRRRSGKRRS